METDVKAKGEDGVCIPCANGSSSSVTPGSSSSVVMCGSEPLPATHFCFEDEQYKLCGGKTYNPPTQFCDYNRTPEQAYKFVEIGGLTWMAENLNYYNSTWDNNVLTNTSNDDKGSWCLENDPDNCDIYGRLYTWKAALEACPSGWHLPELEEFENLVTAAGGFPDRNMTGEESEAFAKKLRASSWNGTDDLDFSALPAKGRNGRDHYYSEAQTWMWSATDNTSVNENTAINLWLYGGGGGSLHLPSEYSEGLSVRCVRDED